MIGRLVIGAAALAVLAYAAALVFGGVHLPAPGEAGVNKDHVILLVVATLAASLLHVGASIVAHRAPPRLFFVLVVAIAARLILVLGAAPPVLEGDRERLRFEGRLINLGVNPYEFVPEQLGEPSAKDALLPAAKLVRVQKARAALSASDDSVAPEELRRPDQRTSSMPIVLWAAAAADRLKPTSGLGFAFVILCADVLAGFFLILALRALRLPLGWLLIYAWCPVLLLAGYTTYSLDLLVMPALAALTWCLVCGRRLFAAVPLALCMALRPAMLLLAPVLGRKIGALGALLAVVLALLPFLAFHTPDVPDRHFAEGQVHTWRHHEYNSAVENSLRGVLRHVPYRAENSLSIAGVSIVSPEERLDVLLAKVCCMVILLGVLTYTVIRVRPDADLRDARFSALGDMFTILVAMLLLSPVLQPNHALWLLPILVVRPMGMTWLAMPGVLSLSYLTHLAGPDAADLTLAGGMLSFRVFEYGILIALVLADVIWRGRLFVEPEELAILHREPEFEFDLDPNYEQDPAYVL